MAVTSGFFNSINGDRKYDAEQFGSIFEGVIKDGVYKDVGDAFAVTATSGNEVQVGTGRGWFRNTWIKIDKPYPLTLSSPDLVLPRYDIIAIRNDKSVGARANTIVTHKGTPATSPKLPTLDDSASVKTYPIASVYRPAKSQSITSSNISSLVGRSQTPWVTSVLEGPEGPPGPPGEVAGAPRLTNLAHDKTWVTTNATINSQTERTVTFTSKSSNGWIELSDYLASNSVYYFTGEVKATSSKVFIGTSQSRVYHSGSGDWKRLTGRLPLTGNNYFMVGDTRSSGWNQIEVRDLVLVNLTEVFGAGREPSKEYMDELLAKQGNYIGASDHFAIGDALQALTVAGQGMTLRHDNSVGTRVLLDHPGGSTMLYGDTGWRDLRLLLEPGWEGSTGTVYVRRVGDTVHVQVTDLAPNDAYESNVLGLPVGFRPTRGHVSGAAEYNGEKLLFSRVTTGGDVQVDHETVPTAVRNAYFSYVTDQAWPTTLPETPA